MPSCFISFSQQSDQSAVQKIFRLGGLDFRGKAVFSFGPAAHFPGDFDLMLYILYPNFLATAMISFCGTSPAVRKPAW